MERNSALLLLIPNIIGGDFTFHISFHYPCRQSKPDNSRQKEQKRAAVQWPRALFPEDHKELSINNLCIYALELIEFGGFHVTLCTSNITIVPNSFFHTPVLASRSGSNIAVPGAEKNFLNSFCWLSLSEV